MQAIRNDEVEAEIPAECCTFDPRKFASAALAEEYSLSFEEFVELIVKGVPRDLAAIEAFRMISHGAKLDNADQIGMACLVNPWVKRRYKEVLESKDIKRDLWTQNDAVNALLRIVKDPRERGATRLNAISQLNVMCDYIKLDEMTNRRIHQTLADFEREHSAHMESRVSH